MVPTEQGAISFPAQAELARAFGEPVASAANRPVRLDDPGAAWFVEAGALDVFLYERQGGEAASSYKHLLRAGPGRIVFGVGDSGTTLAAIAKGLPGTSLYRVRLESFVERDAGDAFVAQVDAWLSEFAAAVASQIKPRPHTTHLLDPAASRGGARSRRGAVLSTNSGGVVWVSAGGGTPAYLGTEEPREGSAGLVPLTVDTWLTLLSHAHVVGASSRDLHAEGKLLRALDEFHSLALGAEQINRRLLLADEVNEQTARAAHRRRSRERARRDLSTVLSPSRPAAETGDSPLLAALEVIGEHEGIAFQNPPRRPGPAAEDPSLQDVLDASGIRARKVRLASEDRWWLGDSGAMLGFLAEDGSPVALIPGFGGRYRAVDPASARSTRLSAERAEALDRDAWLFYPVFPAERPAGVHDLLRLAGKGMAADFGRSAGAGLLASLVALAPAIALGALADRVLPAASGGMLGQVIIALVVFAAVGVLLQMLLGTAMMRIEGRAAARVGAATWDRLLSLPPNFLRSFTAGELALRMTTFQVMRDQLSGVVSGTLLSLVFLLPTLAFLFVYDTYLALLSLGVAFFVLVVTAIFGFLQLSPQRRRYEAARHLSGELFQFINGMSKLRTAGAEASAFASWARGYREQHLAGIQISRINEHLVSFSAAFPALVGAVLFSAAIARGPDNLAVSDFLVIYAVSTTFYAAVAGLGFSLEAIAAAVPGYEQVKPILEAMPERRRETGESVELSGEVHFDHVSFRYAENGPPTIDDVTIRARPGEFIAIVGESGSGKSTLMRLALGLEDAAAGGIYYDGRDLANLDRRSVRRQIGVVMQDGALQPGNLLDNIIGMGDDLTIEDAWEAARLADVDADIAEMPMKMSTVVSNSSSTFSGGQIQRVRIAAALVRNPRIVFLDEATSWLDARSQAQVMRGIESLAATRIVIAHRLSTIRKAERIYVLKAGRVVQQGAFDELYEAEGPFRELVRRQMT